MISSIKFIFDDISTRGEVIVTKKSECAFALTPRVQLIPQELLNSANWLTDNLRINRLVDYFKRGNLLNYLFGTQILNIKLSWAIQCQLHALLCSVHFIILTELSLITACFAYAFYHACESVVRQTDWISIREPILSSSLFNCVIVWAAPFIHHWKINYTDRLRFLCAPWHASIIIDKDQSTFRR